MLWNSIFGDDNWSKVTWSHGAIYVTQLLTAWQAGGDVRFLREVERWYTACGVERRQGGGPQRDMYLGALLMELDPFRHEIWRSMLEGAFNGLANRVLPDGTTLSHIGRSAIDAMGCVSAQRWFHDVDMMSVARHILEALDEDTFRFVRPGEKPAWAGADDTIEQWAIESKLIDGDSLAAWLAAYWEGRWRGYW